MIDDRFMKREKKTIRAMIGIYCREKHGNRTDLCDACRELLDYAMERLKRCTFQENKPTCAKCPIHCYKPEMRQRIRDVMRYAGPRMLRYHPILAFIHLLEGLRTPPERKAR